MISEPDYGAISRAIEETIFDLELQWMSEGMWRRIVDGWVNRAPKNITSEDGRFTKEQIARFFDVPVESLDVPDRRML